MKSRFQQSAGFSAIIGWIAIFLFIAVRAEAWNCESPFQQLKIAHACNKQANFHFAIANLYLQTDKFNHIRWEYQTDNMKAALGYFDVSFQNINKNDLVLVSQAICEKLPKVLFRLKHVDELQLLAENNAHQNRVEKPIQNQSNSNRLLHIALIFLLLTIVILFYFRSVRLKKARDLLNASEQKFRKLAENSPEVIWSCDLDLNLTYISPSTEQLFGFPHDERLQKPMKEIFGEESYNQLKEAVKKNLKNVNSPINQQSIDIELRGNHKNGHEVWVEITADFSFNESGKIIGLQGTARDITGRKQSELKTRKMLEEISQQDEELRVQNEELIRARQEIEKTGQQYFDLFENGPVGYVILDQNGKVVELNATAAQMIRKPKSEILNQNFIRFIQKKERPDFSGYFLEAINRKNTGQGEFNLMPVHVRMVFNPDLVDHVTRCRLAMVDITAQVEAREKLSAALQSLQSVFDAIPGGISVVDKDFRIVNMNQRLQEIRGIKNRSEVLGKKCFEVFQCGQKPCDNCVWKQVFNTAKTVVRNSSPDDSVYHSGNYRIYSSPMFNDQGELSGIVEAAMDITDLRKAQDALAESERKFEYLFNDIPDAVFITRIEGRSGEIINVNSAAEKQTGYSREELLKMNVLTDISVGELQVGLTNLREQQLFTEEKIEFAEQKKHKSGNLFWTEVVVQKIEIMGERFALAVSRDITDRVKIQEEFMKSETRVRSLLSAIPDMLFIFDTEGTFLEYHAMHPEKLLLQPDEFLNRNVKDVMPAGLTTATMENIEKTLKSGKMQLYGYHVDTPQGKMFCDVRMVKASDTTVLCIVRDITDVHKAEEDRRKNEEKYKTLFRNTPLGVFNFNHKGVILDCNDYFVRIIGSSREALIGFNMLERVNDAVLKRRIKEAIDKGSSMYEGVYSSVTAEKHTPVKAFFKCIYDSNGAFIDGIGIVEDVSEQKEYEAQLVAAKRKAEESDRLKSSFMATMSHELRTPLNTVIGFSDMIDESMPIDQILEFTQVITKSGKHLLSIIEDILDISLIDSGEVKLILEKFAIDELMEGLYNFASQQKIAFDKDRIDVEIQLPESYKGIRLLGDVRKINKVFKHLIMNAVKFTRNGKIEFGIDEGKEAGSPDGVLLYVKDTGIGIPKEKHKLIFEIFRQADDSSTREFEGTGLGLTISRKLIKMMGGRVWLESEPGEGAAFYFELPLKASAAETVNKLNQYKKPQLQSMKGITVLVAEDDDTNFHLFKLLLNRRQIDVVRAKNGEEAIDEVSKNEDIRMVLMDINMPVLNGYEATRRIKKIKPEIIVIAVTAYALAGDKTRALEAGCDDYITKPINNQVFYHTLGKYLQK